MAIIEGVCNPKLEDVAVDLGEIELDVYLDDGLLKEIPIIKSVIACRKTWEAIHDRLFLRKVIAFMSSCPKFTETEIQTFVTDHWRGESATRLGNTLVLLLDRLDDLDKPTMLAKVFAAFVTKHINYDAFRRLSSGIDFSSIQDLGELVSGNVGSAEFAEPYPHGLVRSGFAELHVKNVTFGGGGETEAKISKLGELFRRCNVNNWD